MNILDRIMQLKANIEVEKNTEVPKEEIIGDLFQLLLYGLKEYIRVEKDEQDESDIYRVEMNFLSNTDVKKLNRILPTLRRHQLIGVKIAGDSIYDIINKELKKI